MEQTKSAHKPRAASGGRQASAMRIYGCTQAEAFILNDGLPLQTAKANAYYAHRTNAERRGVPWEFTFATWLDVWLSSGKWDERGAGPGQYVMARHGDVGPYRAENVSICTASNNLEQAWANGRCILAPSGLGKGRGWTFVSRYRTNPYFVRVGDVRVGRFPTQEAAEAAYREAVAFAIASGVDSRRANRLNHTASHQVTPKFGSSDLA